MNLGKLSLFGLILASLALADSAYSADAAARQRGQIIVAKVVGEVTATPIGGGDTRVLKEGDVISDQYDVKTGAGANAILAFSNGATVDLGAATELNIQQFVQDPFSGTIKASDMTSEPSTSVTRLDLVKGQLVGKVAHLNIARGSEFVVDTPVGAAGIRGTTFQIVFTPNADGTATYTVSTSEGVVVFTGKTTGQVAIPAGKQVSSTFDYEPPSSTNPTGTVTSPVVITTSDVPQSVLNSIQSISLNIVSTLSNVTLESGLNGGQGVPQTPATISQPINPTVQSPSSPGPS